VRSTVLLLLAALALPASAREFDVRPAPAWIDPAAAETSFSIAKKNARWGIYDLLRDHQVRAGDGTEWQYFRTVRKVFSPSGVQNASELELDFDPSFERLVIHHVEVIRGPLRFDALEPDAVRVIEKEDDSDQRIYDGERTALLFLRDVRPGDVIDYAWSLDGANPILGGAYTGQYDLSSGVPTRRMRHRLLWHSPRALRWKGGQPAVTSAGDARVFVWERSNVPALDVEDEIPSWYEPWQSIEVTDFESWQEVAAWANALFVLDERSLREVKQLAGRITSEHTTRDARITAAIRFVQDDIRYLGIEMGRNSHEPHQPWETLQSRWGDCKDKTLLLVGLLRQLGLDAHPALVNTRLKRRLGEKLPSPFLFDHVVARVVDQGRVYWVDGTISEQGGTLATIETPSDDVALVVDQSTTGLTAMRTNTKGAILVEQTYTTTDYERPTLLTVKTTWSGAQADAVRSALAALSAEDFAQERINDLAIDQPKIEARGLPAIDDDRLRNVVTAVEQYSIRELWADGDWSWFPREIGVHLTRPETMIRSMPLAFSHPLHVQQIATFDFPEALAVEKSTSVTETPTFRYESSVDSNGKTVSIRQVLRSRSDAVAVSDVPEHLTKLSAIWSEMGFRLAPDGATKPVTVEASSRVPAWLAGGVVMAGFVGLCWALATRRRTPRAVRVTFAPGAAPASALQVAHADEIDLRLSALPCTCGAMHYSSPEFQRARYAERDLTIVTRNCGACGREQSVYFTAA
jgi:hypothetical protein